MAEVKERAVVRWLKKVPGWIKFAAPAIATSILFVWPEAQELARSTLRSSLELVAHPLSIPAGVVATTLVLLFLLSGHALRPWLERPPPWTTYQSDVFDGGINWRWTYEKTGERWIPRIRGRHCPDCTAELAFDTDAAWGLHLNCEVCRKEFVAAERERNLSKIDARVCRVVSQRIETGEWRECSQAELSRLSSVRDLRLQARRAEGVK